MIEEQFPTNGDLATRGDQEDTIVYTVIVYNMLYWYIISIVSLAI